MLVLCLCWLSLAVFLVDGLVVDAGLVGVGAYKYQKAPKYRNATKIPESTYKYQKAMKNIGKMGVIAVCIDYKLLFLCAWIMIDAHKCSTLVRVWFMCLQRR